MARPLEIDGVRRPFEKEGVARPFTDALEDATEDGRGWGAGLMAGGDNFVVATKTPHLGGHSK